MVSTKGEGKAAQSQRAREIDVREFKIWWSAETATMEEALSLRKRVIRVLENGNADERKTAQIIKKCRKVDRCGSSDCPVCVRRRLRKARRKLAKLAPPPTAHDAAPGIVTTRASDITPEKVEWLWPGRIPQAKLTVIAGDPGLGKSQLACFLAATVSTGGEWPCDEGRAPLGTVIMLIAEDDAGDTVVPRLDVGNADRSRIHLFDVSKANNDGRPFNLSLDAQVLEREIRRFGNVRLIVVDPIAAFVKSTAAQRAAAASLQKVAANLNAAIVVVSHRSKTARGNALTQVTGSLGLVAVARAVFIVAQEKGTHRCLFLPVKNNLANGSSGLAYRTEQKMTSEGIISSAVVWDASPVTISANEAKRSLRTETELLRLGLRRLRAKLKSSKMDKAARKKQRRADAFKTADGYRGAAFNGDRERVEFLFGLYEKLISPLIAATSQKMGRRRVPRSA